MSSISLNATRSFSIARDLLKLSKHRLSALVAFTAGVGYASRADPDDPDPAARVAGTKNYYRGIICTTAGTWLAAACANTLNQMYEIRSDALMARTRLRPLPSGRIGLAQAACFALATGVSGVSLLAHETNEVTTSLAAANIFLYAGVYTPLKAISTINTWIGAVVGALPPMHGWAAASGGKLFGDRERGAWALGSLLFVWQIPHFHALAVVSRADYAAGGLKMLAVTDPTANAAWARIMSAAMIPAGTLFTMSGVTSGLFGVEAAVLGLWMYRGSLFMSAAPTSVSAARPLFRASISHLPVTLSLLLAHRIPYDSSILEEQATTNMRAREIRYHQPWEIMAPFPFLPVPCGVPAVVIETEDS